MSKQSSWSNENWRDSANCKSIGPDIFFSDSETDTVRSEEVMRFCGNCAVRAACLDFAIATKQYYGIWGGCTEKERRTIRRQRNAELRRQRIAS